jgi:glycerol-3-phosphate dehydrogenase (NAD(P)+)
MKKAIVLGAGSWGTALAAFLAEQGLSVQFWGRDAELMATMQRDRQNPRYMQGLPLPAGVTCTHDLTALSEADFALFVVPSRAMRDTAAAVKAAGVKAGTWVSCTKGVEQHTGQRMTQVLADFATDQALAVLTGPNHAEEVAQRQPTAAVIAAASESLAQRLQSVFTAPWFRSYTTDDVAGVEWAGAMKNPYAIGAGIARGLNLGDNAIAALVTRALAEMMRLGQHLGGKAETFSGLSGIGDLVATCYSLHSRNNQLGMALGRGQKLTDYQAGSRMVAEGVPNTLSLREVAQKAGVRTPLLDGIYDVLYADVPPRTALASLLAREPRAEVG